jgi:hypothetical protein
LEPGTELRGQDLIQAVHKAVLASDGQLWTAMHAGMTHGRMAAVSGLAVSVGQLGMLAAEEGPGCQVVRLGSVSHEYRAVLKRIKNNVLVYKRTYLKRTYIKHEDTKNVYITTCLQKT